MEKPAPGSAHTRARLTRPEAHSYIHTGAPIIREIGRGAGQGFRITPRRILADEGRQPPQTEPVENVRSRLMPELRRARTPPRGFPRVCVDAGVSDRMCEACVMLIALEFHAATSGGSSARLAPKLSPLDD